MLACRPYDSMHIIRNSWFTTQQTCDACEMMCSCRTTPGTCRLTMNAQQAQELLLANKLSCIHLPPILKRTMKAQRNCPAFLGRTHISTRPCKLPAVLTRSIQELYAWVHCTNPQTPPMPMQMLQSAILNNSRPTLPIAALAYCAVTDASSVTAVAAVAWKSWWHGRAERPWRPDRLAVSRRCKSTPPMVLLVDLAKHTTQPHEYQARRRAQHFTHPTHTMPKQFVWKQQC
jgi:hypothetical protein